MNIAVFCAATDVGEAYTSAARALASLMVSGGHSLTWGGSDKGTMKIMADTVQNGGGKIYGVSVELIKSHARKSADEMYIAKDWPERKERMLARADAIVVMPGGIGTLDEAADVLEKKKHSLHSKPVVFMNTDGFYEGLKQQMERMRSDGFLTKPLDEFTHFADTPEDAMHYIESHAKAGTRQD
jgi:hypothetical protein